MIPKTNHIIKQLLIGLCTLLGIVPIYAQDKQGSTTSDISNFTATKAVIRLYLPYPSVEGEFRIAPRTTLKIMGKTGIRRQTIVSIDGMLPDGSLNYTYKRYYCILPIWYLGVNQYVNVKRRINKNKRVDRFSANYVYARISTRFYETLSRGNILALGGGIGYGLHRNIGRTGFFGTSLGLDYWTDRTYYAFRPNVGIQIGFTFPRANEKYRLKQK